MNRKLSLGRYFNFEQMQEIKKDKKYFRAVAVMIGYIIGVGMFGLPFLTAKAGYVTFFIFLITLGFAQYLIHLIYANMIVVTESYHRLPGYVGIYLGQKSKIMVFIAKVTGNIGALLAYIIISGIFLNQLLSPVIGGSEFFYTTAVLAMAAVVIYFGIGMIAKFELFMSVSLFLVVILMAVRGMPVMQASNFVALDWKYFLIPYGAMLLALDGNGSLPIVAKILKKDHRRMKSVIRTSLLISVFITILFTMSIVGISGPLTSPDALTGVNQILGDGIITFALIFGVFSMVTSILGVSEAIKETLMWDFGFSKLFSWSIAIFSPYILYLLGFKDLIQVIGFIGAVMGGFCAIMMILVFKELKKRDRHLPMFTRKPGKFLSYSLISLFLAGLIYELFVFFK